MKLAKLRRHFYYICCRSTIFLLLFGLNERRAKKTVLFGFNKPKWPNQCALSVAAGEYYRPNSVVDARERHTGRSICVRCIFIVSLTWSDKVIFSENFRHLTKSKRAINFISQFCHHRTSYNTSRGNKNCACFYVFWYSFEKTKKKHEKVNVNAFDT